MKKKTDWEKSARMLSKMLSICMRANLKLLRDNQRLEAKLDNLKSTKKATK